MKKMRYSLFAITLIFMISCDNKQPVKQEEQVKQDNYYEKCIKLALSENKVGQEYMFKVVKNEIDEFHVVYLGSVKTTKGDTLKFVTAINYFGLYEDSKRGNGALRLYGSHNDFLGVYHLGSATSVPSRMEGSNIIFSYNDQSCNQTTSISFLDSIPQQIFVNCTEKGGDLYSFTKE